MSTYDIDSTCDWCEKNVPCRYMYDNEVPVLAICQRCDTSPNTNDPKENEIMAHLPTTEEMTAMMPQLDVPAIHQLLDPQRQNLIVVVSTPRTDTMDPARVGYVYNGSDYMGRFLINDGVWTLVADRGDRDQSFPYALFAKSDVNTQFVAPIQNANQKENTIMDTNEKCCAIVNSGTCKNAGKFTESVFVQGMTAYRHDALPQRYVGGGWLLQDIMVCGTHKNTLAKGSALSHRSIRPVVTQTKAVIPFTLLPGQVHKTELKVNDQGWTNEWWNNKALAEKHLASLRNQKFVTAKVVRQAKNEHGWWVAWMPFKKVGAPVAPPVKKTVAVVNNGVLCGNCKEHHASAAEVKACYTSK